MDWRNPKKASSSEMDDLHSFPVYPFGLEFTDKWEFMDFPIRGRSRPDADFVCGFGSIERGEPSASLAAESVYPSPGVGSLAVIVKRVR